jgi:thiamine pyrophosphate-dependent acetolactate synthase large subunit-like protein
LVSAKDPLLIVGYSGRRVEAIAEAVKLADTVKGLRVLDAGGSEVCFPADHLASLGVRPGGIDASVRLADFILVVDCDVPWMPTQCKPKSDTKIIHIDVDPLKKQMPVHYIPALARYQADCTILFKQINTYLSIHSTYAQTLSNDDHINRWPRLAEVHAERLQSFATLGKLPSDPASLLNTSVLTAAVRRACPSEIIWCIEAVTQTSLVADQIQATIPHS